MRFQLGPSEAIYTVSILFKIKEPYINSQCTFIFQFYFSFVVETPLRNPTLLCFHSF